MNILITVGCFWLSFFIIMKYLEIKYPDSVYSFLDKIEVTISIFYIKWRTTKLNSFFHSMGSRGNRILRVWFFCGVVFGVVGMCCSVLLLVCNLFFVVFLWKKESQQVNGVLTPVIPGVNVPTSHLGYYVFALLVAGILHEFGHAFAAVSEKCRINGFGMFLMGVYPGAYVDIGDGLQRLSPLSQLKIYCGGSWHNAVIAAGCGIILFLLPYLVLPLYVYGAEGPYIMNVHKDSIFASRVSPGDTITGIGDCSTKTSRDYENCILESFSLLGNHSIGYCLMSGYLADYGTETFECFDSEYDGPLQGFVADNTENEHYCLIASEVMQAPVCRSNDEETAYGNCQCVFPRLAPNVALLQLHVKTKKGNENINNNNNNNERITNNKYYNKKYNNNEKHITFVGTPQELWYSFTVRDYIFRFESLSFLDIDIPAIIDKSLRYLASISAALAMLNMAPVYFLDGEWCLRPFILLLESFLGLSLLSRRSLSSSISNSLSSSSSSVPSNSPNSNFPNSPSLSASVLSPSLPSYSPSSPSSPFHFVGNMEATAVSFNSLTNNYHGIQMDSDKEEDKRDRHEKVKEKERDKDTETKEKANEDPLVKNILRVVSVLFVINIGLSFINLAWT